jgi:hypothetical protein
MTTNQTEFGTLYHQLDRVIDELRGIKDALVAAAAASSTAAD